jgi:hypothetical protein
MLDTEATCLGSREKPVKEDRSQPSGELESGHERVLALSPRTAEALWGRYIHSAIRIASGEFSRGRVRLGNSAQSSLWVITEEP